MNAGKQFEKDFKESISSNVWYYRFKDSPATYDMNSACNSCPQNKQKHVRFATKNICDCEIYKMPNLFLLELKTTNQKSLAFSMVRDNQINELTSADVHKGIVAGFIVNFRAVNETYFMPVVGFNYYKKVLTSKSIPIAIFRDNCLKIEQMKLRIHWKYNIDGFVKQITNE